MTDGEEIPQNPRLSWIAKTSITLGIISLIRFAPELVTIVPKAPRRVYYLLVLLDLVVGGLWLKSGLALRKHGRGAVRFAAFMGAVIFAHSLTSAIFFAREISRIGLPSRDSSEFFILLAFLGSRYLIYVAEFLFWPYALYHLVKMADEPDAASNPRRSVILAIIVTFLVAVTLHCIFLATVFDR
jgi:hypothetical protein